MRVLCAVSTPFQVNFFEELVRKRPEDEYIFAARDRDATLSMLRDKDLHVLFNESSPPIGNEHETCRQLVTTHHLLPEGLFQ